MKRIVLITGFTETLEFFSLQLAEAFRRLGRDVFLWDMKRPVESREGLESLEGESVLLTFNFIGLQKAGQFLCGDEMIWEKLGMEVYCILVDSPIYYRPMLADPVKHLHLLCIDRNHGAFLEQYYPEFGKVPFLPLAGTEYIPFGGQIPYSKRPVDVIFTGNYVAPQHLEPHLAGLDEEIKAFLLETVRGFLENPELVMETELVRRAEEAFGSLGKNDLMEALYHMVYVDLYVRSWYRGRIVSSVADAGIPVYVTGKDWELAPCRRKDLLQHTGREVTSAEWLEHLGRAKVSLNMMPWFKAGAHDRIWNSMLQGCAVLTDSSDYLQEILMDGGNCRLFSLKALEDIPRMAEEMLELPEQTTELALRGYELASSGHTWVHRAEDFLKMLDK
jgi:hypothetical protein